MGELPMKLTVNLFGGPNGPGGQVDVAVGNGETRFLGRFNQGLKLW